MATRRTSKEQTTAGAEPGDAIGGVVGDAGPKVRRARARTAGKPATTRVAPAASAGSDESAPSPSLGRESADGQGADPAPTLERLPVALSAERATGPDGVLRAARVEITQGGARDVAADTLTITQGGANHVEAHRVDIQQGGIGRANAHDIAVSQGGIGFARGDQVSVEFGGVGLALGGEVRVSQGFVQTSIARDVRIEQGGAQAVLANRVAFARSSGALIVVARNVEGEVRALLDWRGAIAFGAAFGAVVGLLRRRR